jgi:hypothetical protein
VIRNVDEKEATDLHFPLLYGGGGGCRRCLGNLWACRWIRRNLDYNPGWLRGCSIVALDFDYTEALLIDTRPARRTKKCFGSMPATKYDGCFRTQEFEPKTRQLRVRECFLITRRGFT